MSVAPTQRFADAATSRAYPLPTVGPAPWAWSSGAWELSIALNPLPAGTILVPSLAWQPPAGAAATHQWTLTAPEGVWPLQAVPAERPVGAVPNGSPVSTHIDCYHVHRPLREATLRVTVQSADAPGRYLASVSARPVTVVSPATPDATAGLATSPPPRSQTTAPEAIANRICSPTSVSMVLALWQRSHDWLALARDCHDPVSGLYGVWPLALAAAARHGSIGAVEVFSDWRAPLEVLRQGIPLVTSIRFGRGELPGAPLSDTGGHLVVLYAADPEAVWVCDPAATPDGVQRRYPADAFSRAWLRHRGAAYILPP
jgi:hypothetical protein